MAEVTRDGVTMDYTVYSIEILDSNNDPAGGVALGPIALAPVVSVDKVGILSMLDAAAESVRDALLLELGMGYTATISRALAGTKHESV